MKKVKESLLQEKKKKEIRELIKISKEKFFEYDEYLDQEFYGKLYLKAGQIENEEDIDIEIENMIMKRLAYLSNIGNIELLEKIINDYKCKAKLIIERIGKNKIYDERIEEDLIIKSLETYQGDRMFSLHMVSIYRKMHEEKSNEKAKKYIKKNS